MPEPCRCLLANSGTGTIVSNRPPSPAGRLLLTVVFPPLSSVMMGSDRPDGSLQEAGERRITPAVTGVGSGVNGDRATLRKILADPQVSGIVVGHRDRLARFRCRAPGGGTGGRRPPGHRGEPG
jgi:putative resolvase